MAEILDQRITDTLGVVHRGRSPYADLWGPQPTVCGLWLTEYWHVANLFGPYGHLAAVTCPGCLRVELGFPQS